MCKKETPPASATAVSNPSSEVQTPPQRIGYDNSLDKLLVENTINGNLEKVKELLNKGANPNATYNGVPALIWAVYKGHTDIVALLLENGANINIQDKDGDTPLIVASIKGNEELIKLLLSKNCDLLITSKNGKSALNYLKEKDLLYLVDMKPINIELFHAAMKNDLARVKFLLDAGANVNIAWKGFDDQNEPIFSKEEPFDGTTLLLEAASIGNLELVKILVSYGADMNIHRIDPGGGLYLR